MAKKAGRPTKITDAVINQMKNYIMAGVSLKDACELIGIGVTTWREFEQREPSFRRKRKQWQGMLKARAKVNIAEQVFGNKEKGIKPSLQWSQYILDKSIEQETKNAQNALSRANARRISEETRRLKLENDRLFGKDSVKDSTTIIDDIGGVSDDNDKD